jgi:2-iminobutanoate/2-iminopropanoate deaminase
MRVIKSEKIPVPKGHYSPAIEHNGILYISGQVPLDPVTNSAPASFREQVLLVLSKIEMLIIESGSSKNKVLSMRIYLSDIELWGEFNEIYAGFFGDHKPARCVVPVGKLHYGCLIEAEATAYI